MPVRARRKAEVVLLFCYQGCLVTLSGGNPRLTLNLPVAMRFGETPVPIPNTMVKPEAADGTMLETAWESRWLPDFI